MSRAYRRYLLEFYEEKMRRKQQRVEVRETSGVDQLPENEYFENYKVSKEMIEYLCDALNEDLSPKQNGLPVLVKVLSSLKILLSGHYQRGTGQEQNISIAQTTVSKYLFQFVTAVNRRLLPQWVIFPGTEAARQQVAANYQQKFGVAGILGAIDCTHVDLFPTTKPLHVQYMNRHGNTSINVQLVADADCRILHVNARYPGRVHDQFIFNSSIIKTEMQRLHRNRMQYYLLGDSGYGLEPWLMTPIRDAEPNSPEGRYTAWHCKARNVIERTNGYLKGTFRCLGIDRSLHYSPEKTGLIINTCCTLYNIMKHYRLPMELLEVEDEPQPIEIFGPNARPLQIAMQHRQNLINTYFIYNRLSF